MRFLMAAAALLTFVLMAGMPSDAAVITLRSDNLTLGLDSVTGETVSVGVQGKQFNDGVKGGGLYFEDVAAATGPVAAVGSVVQKGAGAVFSCRSESSGLSIEANYSSLKTHIAARVKIKDLTGKDRAIRLTYRLPLSNRDWVWHDSVVATRPATSAGRYEKLEDFFWRQDFRNYPCERYISAYPFSCVTGDGAAFSLGTPLSVPRLYQLAYVREEQSGYLEIAFDLGISADVKKYPSENFVDFIIYAPANPEWGFRSAADNYYGIYPKDFEKRVTKEGIWLLALDPEVIVAPWDFGFGFDESTASAQRIPHMKYGDIFDFYTTHYTEPWGMWLGFDGFENKGRPLFPQDDGVKPEELKKQTLEKVSPQLASLIKASVIYDENGDWVFVRWTDEYPGTGPKAAHLKLAIDPDIPGGYGRFLLDYEKKNNLSKFRKKGTGIDGVYLDSLAGYVGFFPESYRRDQWQYIAEPLVYNTRTHKVCQLHTFSNWAFVKELTDYLHSNDMILIANVYLTCEKWFYPFLDMVGMESGSGLRSDDGRYGYLRTFAKGKPVSWLDYSIMGLGEYGQDHVRGSDEWIAKGFERCLAWAVYPGTAEFTNKYLEAVEKRRPLYKEFIPLIREVSTAGWEPLTFAGPSDEGLRIERFGTFGKSGLLYFTVYNKSESPSKEATLVVDARSLRMPSGTRGLRATDLRTGEELKVSIEGDSWRIAIPQIASEATGVVRIATDKAATRLRTQLLGERVKRIMQTMQWLELYPNGPHDTAWNTLRDRTNESISRKCKLFLANTPTVGLAKRIQSSLDSGKAVDKAAARKDLEVIAAELRKLPYDRYQLAMLEQAESAIKELDSL